MTSVLQFIEDHYDSYYYGYLNGDILHESNLFTHLQFIQEQPLGSVLK